MTAWPRTTTILWKGEWGWTSPEYTAEVLSRYTSPSSRVLDAGAGTGLVAQALFRRGYRELFGIDMAHEMMKIALPKNVYRGLYRVELGLPLPFLVRQIRRRHLRWHYGNGARPTPLP